MAIPVVGFQTDWFPAFYSRESGLKVSVKLETPNEIANFAQAHWDMGMRSAVLVTQPVPIRDEIPKIEMDRWIAQASKESVGKNIKGQALTPYLLQRINELSGGQSLRANIALLRNNAHLAAQIAKAMIIRQKQKYA
jgi:pseudouridine-5'-phosphate glycosidase